MKKSNASLAFVWDAKVKIKGSYVGFIMLFIMSFFLAFYVDNTSGKAVFTVF
ncbi:hypothetical protein UCMB321_4949 [Pseudomonas batumici]|uniref:Uncharacterized protein n=1 Tax=Pseudomonas batumici TaxID=226910 RepID=A0A0C2ERG9_9PSED|nr:hypothetical protein UCMB321_4949 [Pseudomonas batumici]